MKILVNFIELETIIKTEKTKNIRTHYRTLLTKYVNVFSFSFFFRTQIFDAIFGENKMK